MIIFYHNYLWQAKYDRALKHPEIKIVAPDWILDCVDAEKILEEEKYQPSLLTTSPAPGTCNGGVPLDKDTTPSIPGAIAGLSLVTDAPDMGGAVGHVVHPAVDEDGREVVGHEVVSASAHSGRATCPTSEEQTTAMEVDLTISMEDRRESEEKMDVVMEQASSLPARANHAFPSGPSEKLLDGITIFFTDYQECIEDDTLEKWKLVSFWVVRCLHVYM